MMYRIFAALGLSLCLCATLQARNRPNFVFFLVDDLGWTDLGCFGSSFYDTPHIDSLAASGMRFTNAYANCGVCSPTRASILTGRNPVEHGITTYISGSGNNRPENWKRNTPLLPSSYEDRMALEETTIAEALREADYRTFFAGKWHLGGEGWFPEDQGFEYNKGGLNQGGPYGGNKYFSPYGNDRLEDGPEGEHLPDRLASETVAFMEKHRDEPFFAYLSFYSVHTPLMAREDLRAKYEAKAREKAYQGKRFIMKDGRPHRVTQDHAVYGGMIEAVDLAVGKVLQGLKDLGLEEDTVIFFMADNGGLSTSEGWPTSNLPLRAGKGWNYEGGIREPVIARYPGVAQAGSVNDSLIIGSDFYPTILELARLPLRPDQHTEGKSFAKALQGHEIDRGSLYWHFPHYGNQGGRPSGAIRQGDWKLIENFEDGSIELYNLASDIGETTNLASRAPQKANAMLEELHRWQESNGARFPVPNPNYDESKVADEGARMLAKMRELEQEHDYR